jgi:hypothetical protein
MLVREIHRAVLAYLPGWAYVTLVLTQDDRVGRKDGKVWMQLLRGRLSVGGALVEKVATYVEKVKLISGAANAVCKEKDVPLQP